MAKIGQLRRRSITPALTRDADILRNLRRDGIALIPRFVDGQVVRAIRAEVHSNTDLLGEAVHPDIVKRNARRLLLNPRGHVPSSKQVFDDSRISDIMQAYLSPHAVPDREAIQAKIAIGEESIVDLYHIDEWRPLLSVFVYLTDVGSDNAAMEYLVGSHRWSPWRIRLEQDFFEYYRKRTDGQYANDESAYAGCILPTQARRLRARHNWRSMCCDGPAGTLVVFDNLGLHRARPLLKGSRLLLSSYWQLPEERSLG
ncbi:phytanoyl-CoA dioxygenase family protein [Frankia sp. CiP3]|uniref:phytanoyl-CoA dioxygenase family protein n=1 Tax=Frankia sp. CiP3 TaxID=2880971 RepID=UPI001EF4EF49|nr:phytanoyl-CoA dioxygenase family protein [Frankia sp. CiP3]